MSIRKGSTIISGTTALYTTSGQNEDGAMTQKATTDYFESAYVRKTGSVDEEITGTKAFKSLTTNFGLLTDPLATNTTISQLISQDNARKYRGLIQNWLGGSSETAMVIRTYNSAGTSADLQVWVDESGNKWTYAPTPSSKTDNSTQIATTAWVTNHRCTSAAGTSSTASIYAPAYVIQNYRSGTTWYRIWSDNWKECGGRVSASSQTVTYPVTFSNTNYTLTGGLINGTTSATYEHLNMSSLTTTTFYYTAYDSYQLMWTACGY